MASQDTRIGRARERARQARWILAVAALAGFGWAFAFAKGSNPGASTVEQQEGGGDTAVSASLGSSSETLLAGMGEDEAFEDDDEEEGAGADLGEIDDFFGSADVAPASGSADLAGGPASHAS